MGMGLSTINTVLKVGSSPSNATKPCRIKSYPDLGGSSDLIESTDLIDTWDSYVPGVRSVDALEFLANFSRANYDAVLATANKPAQYYRLEMGEDGEDGVFIWYGSHNVWVNSGEVDAVREMTISCILASRIYVETGAGSIIDEDGLTLVTNKGNPIGFVNLQ